VARLGFFAIREMFRHACSSGSRFPDCFDRDESADDHGTTLTQFGKWRKAEQFSHEQIWQKI
jgi:hypothetical protein